MLDSRSARQGPQYSNFRGGSAARGNLRCSHVRMKVRTIVRMRSHMFARSPDA